MQHRNSTNAFQCKLDMSPMQTRLSTLENKSITRRCKLDIPHSRTKATPFYLSLGGLLKLFGGPCRGSTPTAAVILEQQPSLQRLPRLHSRVQSSTDTKSRALLQLPHPAVINKAANKTKQHKANKQTNKQAKQTVQQANKTNKQTSKQTSKQTDKQTNSQANKQGWRLKQVFKSSETTLF